MEERGAVERFDRAVLLLPHNLRERARELSRERRARAEEFRLRLGRQVSAVMPEGELCLGGDPVTKRELGFVLEGATGASMHSCASKLREGFITARGGFRIGVCGSVGVLEASPVGFTSVSSVAIRISRELKGVCAPVIGGIFDGERVRSTLIISPPGGGKTTLLRDVVRYISDADNGPRVGLCDERSEIAAYFEGEAGMDVGRRTDTLDGCPKAKAVNMLLRAMNPQVIALDEITGEEDARALIKAAHCGVKLIATAHAFSASELRERPVYRELLEAGIFSDLVTIRSINGERTYLREALN